MISAFVGKISEDLRAFLHAFLYMYSSMGLLPAPYNRQLVKSSPLFYAWLCTVFVRDSYNPPVRRYEAYR